MGRKIAKSITISILNDRGKIRLRWRYDGKRYALSSSQNHTSENLILIKALIGFTKSDIKKNRFDDTLTRYRGCNIADLNKPGIRTNNHALLCLTSFQLRIFPENYFYHLFSLSLAACCSGRLHHVKAFRLPSMILSLKSMCV